MTIIPVMSTRFTTLFLRLSQLIYFFFTSFYSHGLVTKFLRPPRPFLLHLYLLLLLWAYWPLSLSCQSIEFTNLFLGFPDPFTFSLPLIIPNGLLFHSLGILGLFISSLPLVIFMGLLALTLATPTHWACFLISLLFFPSFSSHLLYCWASSTVGPFAKKGHQQLFYIIGLGLKSSSCLPWNEVLKKRLGNIVIRLLCSTLNKRDKY